MSRTIEPKASVTLTKEEAQLLSTDSGKLLFTSYQGQSCALLIQNDRLAEATFFPRVPSKVGAVYIGKVKSLAKNINACFVEIEDGEMCFLPMKSISAVLLLNRNYDGRILEGDELLVQVTSDAQKSKRASVTTQISVSNDYFVLSMGSDRVCFSAKLEKKKKEHLNKLFVDAGLFHRERNCCLSQEYDILLSEDARRQMKSEGLQIGQFCLPPTGVIVRTKAEETESIEELLGHFHALTEEYVRLLYIARFRSICSCLKRANTGIETALQQFCSGRRIPQDSGWEIITDQEDCYGQLMQYCEDNNLHIPVRLYQDSMLSLSTLYSLEGKLKTALDSRVWLKSGGYLVIEPTEALTVIDVNSGKYESEKNPQDAYRQINLEAAAEVAFQLRLRNLSGIIIVDFINMQSPSDNARLLYVLRDLVKRDGVKTTVVDMTPLGLVEITRKKISKPLREQLSRS